MSEMFRFLKHVANSKSPRGPRSLVLRQTSLRRWQARQCRCRTHSASRQNILPWRQCVNRKQAKYTKRTALACAEDGRDGAQTARREDAVVAPRPVGGLRVHDKVAVGVARRTRGRRVVGRAPATNGDNR